ncbi:MAG: hypothetical protein R2766_04845 [Saprospiraceae bacterium]
MMVRYGEYQRARQLLNTFNRPIEAPDDFVTVQLINLDFLAATGTYTLSAIAILHENDSRIRRDKVELHRV